MTDTEKGDAFVIEIAKLAKARGIEPWHAIQCFGKIAAMMMDYEMQRGRFATRDEALAKLMVDFEHGIRSWPVAATKSNH